MIVLIDNGHGIDTPGKRSPDGRLREYKYCRQIAYFIYMELIKEGIDSKLIVEEDYDVSLAERCRRVNAHKDAILISIHLNAAGNGQWMLARGWEAWTTPGKTKSDKLATLLYEQAEKHLPGMKIRKDVSDGDPDKESNFYILKNTNCPAVLTENLFQDNKEDVAFLESQEGISAIVNLHVEAIKKYLYEG